MEFTEAIGDLCVSPHIAEFTYEDEDLILWQLKYGRSKEITVKAGICLKRIEENDYLDMVRKANEDRLTLKLNGNACHITYQEVLGSGNELYRRLPEISAVLIATILFIERMCSCVD